MIDAYLLTAIVFAVAITTVFIFMVITNVSQNRALQAEHVNNDVDAIMISTVMSEYSEQKLNMFKSYFRGE